MPNVVEADTPVTVQNVSDASLKLWYVRLRCKRQPPIRIDCIDYAVFSQDENGDPDKTDCWGEIRVDRHSQKVIVTSVCKRSFTAKGVIFERCPIEHLKFSSELDAVQALRLLRIAQETDNGTEG